MWEASTVRGDEGKTFEKMGDFDGKFLKDHSSH